MGVARRGEGNPGVINSRVRARARFARRCACVGRKQVDARVVCRRARNTRPRGTRGPGQKLKVACTRAYLLIATLPRSSLIALSSGRRGRCAVSCAGAGLRRGHADCEPLAARTRVWAFGWRRARRAPALPSDLGRVRVCQTPAFRLASCPCEARCPHPFTFGTNSRHGANIDRLHYDMPIHNVLLCPETWTPMCMFRDEPTEARYMVRAPRCLHSGRFPKRGESLVEFPLCRLCIWTVTSSNGCLLGADMPTAISGQ